MRTSRLVLCLALAGCAGSGAPPQEIPLQLAGDYEITTKMSLQQLPPVVTETLNDLAQFKDKPTATIIKLLKAAKIPIVDTVLGFIPSWALQPIEAVVDGLIKEELFESAPWLEKLGDVMSGISAGLKQFDLLTTLGVPQPDAAGNGLGEHALAGVVYTWNGAPKEMRLPQLLVLGTRDSNVSMNLSAPGKGDAPAQPGRVDVGDHTFTLPLGEFAVTALSGYLQSKFGVVGLKGLLQKFIDCEAISTTVSQQCIASFCIGHKAEIQKFCDDGITTVASQIESRLKGLQLKIHFASGEAALTALANRIEKLESGSWDIGIDVGQGETLTKAPFVGKRIP